MATDQLDFADAVNGTLEARVNSLEQRAATLEAANAELQRHADELADRVAALEDPEPDIGEPWIDDEPDIGGVA